MPPVPEGYKSKKAPTSNPFVDDLRAGYYEQGQWLTRDDIEKCVVEFNPSLTKEQLLTCGMARIIDFCIKNKLEVPTLTVTSQDKWQFDPCAYWRPVTPERGLFKATTGIHICLEKCADIAQVATSRNWNWPGCTVDRTPHGVLAHEVGHLMDWTIGEKKGPYYSEFSEWFQEQCQDEPLTSYCPNPAEYFAEHARLFVTNPDLLSRVRPSAYRLLAARWKPVSIGVHWLKEVGKIPDRIRKAQERKMQ